MKGKITVTLKCAYASGPEGAGDPVHQILLTPERTAPAVVSAM
ncbi:MAG: hypothetical protein ABI593_09195 [Betaproteobacteria bacterium]